MKHRPEYHFLPEKNWMNDPNATIYFKGVHHLFYQYNPTDWHWGNLHYGHATSEDLLHWREEPIAMYPALERGETHCYSGSNCFTQVWGRGRDVSIAVHSSGLQQRRME